MLCHWWNKCSSTMSLDVTICRPFCIHSARAEMLVPLSASFEPPLSNQLTQQTLWDCFRTYLKTYAHHGIHGKVWTSCVPHLYDLGYNSACFVPPKDSWLVLWSHTRDLSVNILFKEGIMIYNCSSDVLNMTLNDGADHPLHHRPSVSEGILSHFHPHHASISLIMPSIWTTFI